MYQEIIDSTKQDCDKALDYLKKELTTFRTGRASRALVENLMIDYYGTKTPLYQIATINVPETQQIVIQPYDINSIKSTEKAILSSRLGLTPNVQGNIIRIILPPLSEERRKELVSVLHQKLEEVKISMRSHREEAWKEIKNKEAEGTITEDEKYKAKEELDKLVKEYNDKIEEIGQAKEKEIMTI
jgi:ribosome recycling factor